MVKPTIGICCEFAQKHAAEFMQNFFEKTLDIFAWRVYNDIVPGKTGAKKTAGHGRKRYRMTLGKIYIRRYKARVTTTCDICGEHTAKMTRLVHDSARVTTKGTFNTDWRMWVCDECRRKGTAVKDVPVLKHGGIQATKSSPVITTVTLNARDRHFWAARLLLMAAGFKAVKGTAQKYEIHAAFAGVNRWLKAHAEAFPISKVGYTDIATGREFEASRSRDALDGWLTETQEMHGSDPVTGIISKPTK